jgi:hypothetical protein
MQAPAPRAGHVAIEKAIMESPSTLAPLRDKPRRKSSPKERARRARIRQRAESHRKKQKALRVQLATDEDAILTFLEWCALNGLSERQGRRVLARGGGPVITQLSPKRIGISRRHNREWLEWLEVRKK